jgi:hypothetical protein
MTRFTSDRRVRADQRKICQTVIETGFCRPRNFRVTGFALTAELAHVRVVCVTAGAIERQADVGA